MILIWDHRYFYKKRTSKGFLRFSSFFKSSYNKPFVDFSIVNFIISLFNPFIAKYIKENLQKILRTILEAYISLFVGPYEKLLKARSPNVYCNKSYIECYNFC